MTRIPDSVVNQAGSLPHSGHFRSSGTYSSTRHRRTEIAEVLVRYELGHLLDALGLQRLISADKRLMHRGTARTRPESLRMALGQLGPTFIKLGQIVSTRADLLSPEYQTELAKLQDEAERVPSDVIQAIVESELGTSTKEAFASFDLEPLAAASIGQVHAATLHDGSEVVVKVRRPGAKEIIEQDLEILRDMAAKASQRWPEAQRWDLTGLAKDFSDALRAELDYLQEANNAQEFQANFADDPSVHIPTVHPELSTSSVLTLERIRGIKISKSDDLISAALDPTPLAGALARAFAKMVLIDGEYHGDPHPGNYFIEQNGTIGIVDFGRVGRIDSRLRWRLGRLLFAVLRRDPDRLTSALLAVQVGKAPIDRQSLREDLSDLMSRYEGESLSDIPITTAMKDIQEVVRGHNLNLGPDVTLLLAVVAMAEGLAKQLDPAFRFDDVLAEYVTGQVRSAESGAVVAELAEEFEMEADELTRKLLSQLQRLHALTAHHQIEDELSPTDVQRLDSRIERAGNRISMSLLVAAAINLAGRAAAQGGQGPNWRKTFLASSAGVLATVGAYEGWRHSSRARILAGLVAGR
jgi:ubiquinone biosynthesis protein